jgi:hypothetical protein
MGAVTKTGQRLSRLVVLIKTSGALAVPGSDDQHAGSGVLQS